MRNGFTFIELLVTVTIMAVLMAIAVVSFSSTNIRSRDAKRKVDLESIRSALEICRATYGEYPSSIATNITCTQGGVATATVALNATPDDPKNVAPHVYTYNRTSATQYSISAELELPTDPTTYTLTNP